MTNNIIYTSMTATGFPDSTLADEYVRFIEKEVVPRILKAGALSARVVSLGNGADFAYESQYTWPSEEVLKDYRVGVGSEIRNEVLRHFGSKGVNLNPKQGILTLEQRVNQ